MQIKNGIDIIEVNRIKESIEQFGESFLDRLFTKREQEYCEKSKIMKYQHYAARFAAKEAIFKAISENIENSKELLWRRIEITNNENGKPKVNFIDYELKGLVCMDLSVSHINNYAIASFTIIFE